MNQHDASLAPAGESQIDVLATEVRRQYEDLEKRGTVEGPNRISSISDVAAFLYATGDTNPIHQGQNGILPGLFVLSSLPNLLEGKLPITVPGYVTILRRVSCSFFSMATVGTPIRMSFSVLKLEEKTGRPSATFAFRLLKGKDDVIATGEIMLTFLEERLYERMIDRLRRDANRVRAAS